jgi:hypothetical protein
MHFLHTEKSLADVVYVVEWWDCGRIFLIFKNNIFLIKNSRILKIIISNSVILCNQIERLVHQNKKLIET